MKIVSLSAENFKRLRAVSISPDGNLIELTGGNEQGKSSILDAIWAAICGKSAAPALPIRTGEEVAIIKLDLGSLKITRKFINKTDGTTTTSLVVENEEGHRQSPPQRILDDLTNTLSFDPLEFTRLDPKKQSSFLRSLVPDFNFEEADRQIQELMEERRDTNRELAQAKARLEACSVPDDAPNDPIDVASLIESMEKAAASNDMRQQQLSRQRELDQQKQNAEASIENYRKEIAAAQEQIEKLGAYWREVDTESKNLPPLPIEQDLSVIRQRIQEAEEHNQMFNAAQTKVQIRNECEALSTLSSEKSAALEDVRRSILSAVQEADLPVEGLSFTTDGVMVDDLPFENLSQAKQLQVSIAVAAALDPKLRVIRVKDGALLGQKKMEELSEFADQFDMQIWVETVESDRPAAIVIEDGSVSSTQQDAE
ncbi:conserved hypothetical protein [Roseibium sp. TrichSKD4]|uniref:AAA family ATPase n=1 Tax=Roseibium sp. TrichSKD4 TaxID=744980 RepID=UPI0001E56B5B|nr:AAA family ATPase [Roseibium sp. TrichSKD4]EFO30135.1 conserved hypothetical protein [Roseibium sp. TrichSKD4]